MLRSGERLYEEGAAPESCGLVLSGRLRVTAGEALLGYVGRLEPVGEMGVISGEARTATVRAVRDSVVLEVPSEAFVAFLHDHPATLLALLAAGDRPPAPAGPSAHAGRHRAAGDASP